MFIISITSQFFFDFLHQQLHRFVRHPCPHIITRQYFMCMLNCSIFNLDYSTVSYLVIFTRLVLVEHIGKSSDKVKRLTSLPVKSTEMPQLKVIF